MEEFLTIGKIIDSFGLDGTLKIISSTTKAEKRYKSGNVIFLYDEKTNERNELHVISHRSSGEIDFVKVEEISTKEDALLKKNTFLQVKKNSKDLEKGEYFFSDLEKCTVYDEKSKVELGKVSKVEEFPSQITLRVKKKDGKTFFVPFVKEFIVKVDMISLSIFINVVKGLL